MENKRILCWVDEPTKKRILLEFKDTPICFASNFEDFCLNLRSDDVVIISNTNFNDFDTSGFVYEVGKFISKFPDQLFHIFIFYEDDKELTSGLSVGVLLREKNAIFQQIFPGDKYSIQYHIDVWPSVYLNLEKD